MRLISENQFWKRKFLTISRQGSFAIFFWGLCIAWELMPGIVVAADRDNQSLENQQTINSDESVLPDKVLTISSNTVTRISNFLSQPREELKKVVEQFGPYVVAYLNPTPFPSVHARARLAKVPVLMYHDILPQKQVFFDVTFNELERHFELIKASGATPISLDLLSIHLRTGIPLPKKPVVLSFDDGYGGHYQYVYPLLKKYNYPAVFAIYVKGVGNNVGRSHVSWKDLREMITDPLVTIASHSITHPSDLRILPEDKLQIEILESKRVLETNLQIPINYFIYPVGKYNKQVVSLVQAGGYQLGLIMRDSEEKFAGESEDLFTVERFGQSKIESVLAQAEGGSELPPLNLNNNNFNNLTTLLFISLFK